MSDRKPVSTPRFRRDLNKLVNGASVSQRGRLISHFFPIAPLRRQANILSRHYVDVYKTIPKETSSPVHLRVEHYSDQNPHVLEMVTFLSPLKDDLLGAYVHGSLGTCDEIEYSDFDALVIIKERVISDPERLVVVAERLNASQAIMRDFDPLQHHGWFVLTEADLRSYPDDYFPVELFQYAKSLFPDHGLELDIEPVDSSEDRHRSFDNLSQSILSLLKEDKLPVDLFRLKILLSEFMLLPTLYVQMRDGKGIYKKFSFDAAKVDFSPEDWSIMEEVSLLRESWPRVAAPEPSWFLRLLGKRHNPPIPAGMKSVLTEGFYRRMGRFVTLMKDRRE